MPHEEETKQWIKFAEKYLKAFLVSKGQEPPHLHDLAKLAALCETENPDFEQIKQKCIVLAEYGVQPRYPGNMQIIEEDMVRALHFATELKPSCGKKCRNYSKLPVRIYPQFPTHLQKKAP